MKWITAADIREWVSTRHRDCEENLPLLLRRLILHTGGLIETMNFPARDSVVLSGWDGELKTVSTSPFVPNGTSGWEIGTAKSARGKAESDYKKRSASPAGLRKRETTFVFITPRAWPQRRRWEQAKRATRLWKEVRVIAADELEQWLEQAPAVSAWLARHLGKTSESLRDIEDVWREWSLGTKPPMIPAILVAGREEQIRAVQQWLSGPPGVLEVQGDSPDEAGAFLYAASMALPEPDRIRVLARCVVASRQEDMRFAASFPRPLIVVAPAECGDAAGLVVEGGHHVFLSVSAKVLATRDALRLSRAPREAFEQALVQAGKLEHEAQQLTLSSARSIAVLRRLMPFGGTVKLPEWSQAQVARHLLPVLLAGAWSDDKESDRAIAAMLAGVSYDEVVNDVSGWLTTDDPPFQRVGHVWKLRAPIDAWFLLGRHLTRDELERLGNAVEAVLTQTDPKYDLSSEKRWAAAIYGKTPRYSRWLREGLVESLVLLAVFGERAVPQQAFELQGLVNSIVKRILGGARTWEAWASLKDITPLLVEAAPDGFLDALDDLLAENPAILSELMKDDGGIFGECRHSGLLWALESLAWSPMYLTRVAEILGRFADIDPGGRWSNRPVATLVDIFLPRLSHTYASPRQRLAALDALSGQLPRQGWRLLKSYFSSTITSGTHKLRWRDVRPDGWGPDTIEQRNEYVTGLLSRCAEMACATPQNLAEAIAELRSLPEPVRDRVVHHLSALDSASLGSGDRKRIWDCLRGALHDIRSYGRDGSVPAEVMSSLSLAYDRLTPEPVIDRVGWLFTESWAKLPTGEREDHEAYEMVLARARESAAREFLGALTLPEILAFAKVSYVPGVFGYALAAEATDSEDDTLVDGMVQSLDEGWPGLLAGYAGKRYQLKGEEWLARQVQRLESNPNRARGCAAIYLGLPQSVSLWRAVATQDSDVERAFWKWSTGRSYPASAEAQPLAIEKLLSVGRPYAALEIASHPEGQMPTVLLKQIIKSMANTDPASEGIRDRDMLSYRLERVFEQLSRRPDATLEELALLEWPFVRILDEPRRGPLMIHRLLEKDSNVFAQLVSFIYKRDDRKPEPASDNIEEEQRRQIGENAWHALNSWRLVPGADDSTVSHDVLEAWVASAREGCAKIGKTIGGDIQIGTMLAHAPAGEAGVWPHPAVCRLIEALRNKTIEQHVRVGLYNSRGMMSRGPGGGQERRLAEQYRTWAATVADRWPRTASMLREIADGYSGEAKSWDIDSQLDELRS